MMKESLLIIIRYIILCVALAWMLFTALSSLQTGTLVGVIAGIMGLILTVASFLGNTWLSHLIEPTLEATYDDEDVTSVFH